MVENKFIKICIILHSKAEIYGKCFEDNNKITLMFINPNIDDSCTRSLLLTTRIPAYIFEMKYESIISKYKRFQNIHKLDETVNRKNYSATHVILDSSDAKAFAIMLDKNRCQFIDP